jgi:hypothetical protein
VDVHCPYGSVQSEVDLAHAQPPNCVAPGLCFRRSGRQGSAS